MRCSSCEGYHEDYDGDFGTVFCGCWCGYAKNGDELGDEDLFPFRFPLPCWHPPFWDSPEVNEIFNNNDESNDSFSDQINAAGERWDFLHGPLLPREKVSEIIEGLVMWYQVWNFLKDTTSKVRDMICPE